MLLKIIIKPLLQICSGQACNVHHQFARRFALSSWYRNQRNDGKVSGSEELQKNTALTDKPPDVSSDLDSAGKKLMKASERQLLFNAEFSGLSEYLSDYKLIEDSGDRIKRVLTHDFKRLIERQKTRLGFEFESELDQYHFGPSVADVVIIGGGATGSACAYWIKHLVRDGLSVVVVDKDMSCRKSCTPLTLGGLCQQFSMKENIEMALFGKDFLRNIGESLKVENLPTPNACFQPTGYLLLAGEEDAERFYQNSSLQNALGASNVLLTPKSLKERFPWLKTDGIALGCLGVEHEGWFDPWALKFALRSKAIDLGANYIEGEVVGFSYRRPNDDTWTANRGIQNPEGVLIRRKDGKIFCTNCCFCVIAAGAASGFVASLSGIGTGSGLFKFPLPIEARKRHMYCFSSSSGPSLNAPLTIGPDGVSFRREGFFNNYITGVTVLPDEEPFENDFSVDYNYFDKIVRPSLAGLVSGFENVVLQKAWSGVYPHNPIDMSGILGSHPFFSNILFASGFNSFGSQLTPAVGRAIAELIIYSSFQTIDLSAFGFNRFGYGNHINENNVLLSNGMKQPVRRAIE